MNINLLIWRNLKKNLKNYYLYVFALAFSSSLYFAFVTLQYDPALDEASGTIKGAAAIRAASVLLIVIVAVFLLFANNLFIKRRGQEIGLFQLIGMTKGQIFRILTIENFLLYFGSLFIGIFLGFLCSRFVLMILFKLISMDELAELQFSTQALVQTLIVFAAIYLLIMANNLFFIHRQSILSLFKVKATTESTVKRVTIVEIIIGILGIAFILTGYYVSSRLFSGDFTSINELFIVMIFILGSVIVGTYLFFRGSITFLGNVIRKGKGGYLSITDVMSLSSIMFRMKSNALLLTVISTVSALAIGLLSLSYIQYYSAEKSAFERVQADFSTNSEKEANMLTEAFNDHNIAYTEETMEVLVTTFNMIDLIELTVDPELAEVDVKKMESTVVSDKFVEGLDVLPNEVFFAGWPAMYDSLMKVKHDSSIMMHTTAKEYKLDFIGLNDEPVIPFYFTNGGSPTAVVDDTLYKQLQNELNADLQLNLQDQGNHFYKINLQNTGDIEKANNLYETMDFAHNTWSLQLEFEGVKIFIGLTLFITGFLGLTFLITSGCIIYFKQMDEGEEEKNGYTILRKLGYTQNDLLKGICVKQFFTFGIPLVLSLSHSYFAVKSGWFLFGTEMMTPTIIVMVIYTVLYSIFGLLAILHYKKVIKDAL
ncbi:FtsX-like permease family protein [Cytobacillus kochii]